MKQLKISWSLFGLIRIFRSISVILNFGTRVFILKPVLFSKKDNNYAFQKTVSIKWDKENGMSTVHYSNYHSRINDQSCRYRNIDNEKWLITDDDLPNKNHNNNTKKQPPKWTKNLHRHSTSGDQSSESKTDTTT